MMTRHSDSAAEETVATPDSAWRTRADAWEHLGYALTEHLSARRNGHGRPKSTAVISRMLSLLASLEPYWAVPGADALDDIDSLVRADQFGKALAQTEAATALLKGAAAPSDGESATVRDDAEPSAGTPRPTIDVLVIDNGPVDETAELKQALLDHRRPGDPFRYDVNVVSTAQDAVVALVINPNIQACIITPRFATRSPRILSTSLRTFVERRLGTRFDTSEPVARILGIAGVLRGLRPELDIYLMAGVALESLAISLPGHFRRVFSRDDALELHLSVLGGLIERFETPFFTALEDYSRRPGSVFHALPISRGGSVQDSPWISDLAEFYGMNLLLAETSATSGGLDSLLDPHGSIKEAQERAARAFRSHRTYFVTNGTSTANKISHQSIVAPGDIVLVDRNCHKSHHYAFVLAGAAVSYLDAYPLEEHGLFGAVPLDEIKRRLLALRRAGQLERVKMITLTNCTFDGVVYDPRRVMEECLAIKPDLVFLWDEAWFAFAGFHPVYRRRTAMHAAAELEQSFSRPEYRRLHERQMSGLDATGPDATGPDATDPDATDPDADDAWIDTRLIPDPDQARIRVYAAQSTHKTLTSLRQGSIIHVFDQDFARLNEESFQSAFMTHTSTSPNYQILASLDIGRRQVEFEGYGRVQQQADLAVTIERAVSRHRLLKKYFRVLTTDDLVPDKYRKSTSIHPERDGLAGWDEAWAHDEFVIDPSRLTLDISATGVDGDTFKHEYLMDGHSIQVNKTSRNSVLLMTNIGTSRSSVAYLIEVLVKIAEDLDRRRALSCARDGQSATSPTPAPLPAFSRFTEAFQYGGETGDIRRAYYLTYDQTATEYLESERVRAELAHRDVVSAGFVTPYPPGFPVLVPGQVFTTGILNYMEALDTREIHGYDRGRGYWVFTAEALTRRGGR